MKRTNGGQDSELGSKDYKDYVAAIPGMEKVFAVYKRNGIENGRSQRV